MQIEQVSPEDHKKAHALLFRVDELLDSTRSQHDLLLRSYAEIGVTLLEIQNTRAWLLLPEYKTFDQYVMGCGKKFGRGRTALYSFKSVAERLLPSMDKQTLIEIGISKAHVLAQHVKKSGQTPDKDLVERAKNPEVGLIEFKAAVAGEKPEQGEWYEIGGFYASPEEIKELDRAKQLARERIQVPPDASEWLERKLVAQAMAMECISSWEGQ